MLLVKKYATLVIYIWPDYLLRFILGACCFAIFHANAELFSLEIRITDHSLICDDRI
jgi:hypothetical protein